MLTDSWVNARILSSHWGLNVGFFLCVWGGGGAHELFTYHSYTTVNRPVQAEAERLIPGHASPMHACMRGA